MSVRPTPEPAPVLNTTRPFTPRDAAAAGLAAVESVQGVLMDLGVSSMQLDQPERGRFLSPPLVNAVKSTLERGEQALHRLAGRQQRRARERRQGVR